MAARLLLLLCVGSVLSWVGAEDAYARLPESYRSGVDLAFGQLNSHAAVQLHYRFLRSLEKTEIEVKDLSQKWAYLMLAGYFFIGFKGVDEV